MPNATDERGFRPEIEGLRGIAILLVLLFHAGMPGLAGGYVGVDAFFVLSGYLITRSMLGDLARHGRVRLPEFYARRVRRLLPAVAIAFALTAIFAWCFGGPLAFAEQGIDGAAAMLYSANLRFAAIGSDYLAVDIGPSPFLHSWSLGVEEQFYLLYPLLFILLTRLTRGGRRIALGVLLLAAAACAIWLTGSDAVLAFYLLPSRSAPLLAGALLACLPAWPTRHGSLLAALGVFSLLAAALLFNAQSVYPGAAILLPTLATVAAIGGAGVGLSAARALAVAPLRLLGRISYSLYLYHWPVAVFAAVLVPSPSAARIISIIAVSCMLAWLSRRFIEEPFLTHSARPRTVLTRGLGVSLLLVVLMGGGALLGLRQIDPALLALRPPLSALRSDMAAIYHNGCHAPFTARENPDCRYGVPAGEARATVVLLGDSHAAHWFPALERLALERGWTFYSLTKSACPFNDAAQVLGGSVPYDECDAWRRAVAARISGIAPDLVVISASGSAEHVARPATPAGTAAMLEALGAPLLWIADTPQLAEEPALCLERHGLGAAGIGAPECSVPLARASADLADSVATILGADRLQLVDLARLLCPDGTCAPVRGGVLVWRDRDHLSRSYARELAPAILPILEDLLPR